MAPPRTRDTSALNARAKDRVGVQKEQNALKAEELKLERDKLDAQRHGPPGATALLEAVRAARDPLQRVQTDERWRKTRLLEMLELAVMSGDVGAMLKVSDAIDALAKVPVASMSADELAGKTPEELRRLQEQLAGWTELVERRLKESGG